MCYSVVPKLNLRSRSHTSMQKNLVPIQDIARKLGIPEKYIEQIGPYGAKVRLELLSDPAFSQTRKNNSGDGDLADGVRGRQNCNRHWDDARTRSDRQKSCDHFAGAFIGASVWNERRRGGRRGFRRLSQARKSIYIFTAIFTRSRRRTIYWRR